MAAFEAYIHAIGHLTRSRGEPDLILFTRSAAAHLVGLNPEDTLIRDPHALSFHSGTLFGLPFEICPTRDHLLDRLRQLDEEGVERVDVYL